MTTEPWDDLAKAYEDASTRKDSLDVLLDWPAQLRAVGKVHGKSLLDLGCGSGRKAYYFAKQGAEKVVGVDISKNFIDDWNSAPMPTNLKFYQGDISSLEDVKPIAIEHFDVITCFQAIGYSKNLNSTVRFVKDHIADGGRFVLTTAHPFRFAIEIFEARGIPYGKAYREEVEYTYAATWDMNVSVTHSKPMISTYLNTIMDNGFRLDRVEEPDLTNEQKAKYPHKAEWLDKYVGLFVMEFTAL